MTPNRLAAATGRALQALSVAAAVAFAPAALGYDLLQAWRDAHANDPPLAAARANLVASGERVTQARAGLLPQLGGSASLTRTHAELQPLVGPEIIRNFTGRNVGLSLTQPIVRLQSYEAFEQSRLTVVQTEAAYAAVELDLMLRVSQAYFDVLAAQDTLATIRAQKRAIAEQLESAKRSFEVGTATITDQQEAQARFDLTTAQEIGAQNALNVARAALELLVGRPVGELDTLVRDVAVVAPLPAADADWVQAARQNNFNVEQQRIASEIARREIRRARFAELPTLDAVGQVARTQSATAQFVGTRTTSSSIGLQLALPLYQGGALNARVRETIALSTRAEADLEASRRQAEQAARTAYLGVASGLAQVQALEAGERSSRLALESNLLGYQVGVRINIDVLNAQQQLFTTRRDLARARYDTLLNGLRLKVAAGSLRPDDLVAINALLGEAPPEEPLSLQPAAPVPLQGGTARSTPVTPGAAGAGPAGTGVGGMAPRSVPGVVPGTSAGTVVPRPGAAPGADQAPAPPGARGNPARTKPPVVKPQ